MTETDRPDSASQTRYLLYARATPRSRGRLVAIMLSERSAELHADELCASMGYAAVEVRPSSNDQEFPDTIDPPRS